MNLIRNARALLFDGYPTIITDDWREVRLDMTWEEACEGWRRGH